MSEKDEVKAVCATGVSERGALTWQQHVDDSFDVSKDGRVVLWTTKLDHWHRFGGSVWMTPDEAAELARALQFAASAARQVVSANGARQ